jgi:hypothetical protein
MFKRLWMVGFVLSAMLLAQNASAFPCFITLVKDSCWVKYNVTVDVINAADNSVLLTISLPKGKKWSRKSFDAETKQRFMLRARFEPAFWETEAGTEYFAKRYWSLPEVIEGETMAWNVGACYPEDFASVPMPPDAGSDCTCDRREIPAPKAPE